MSWKLLRDELLLDLWKVASHSPNTALGSSVLLPCRDFPAWPVPPRPEVWPEQKPTSDEIQSVLCAATEGGSSRQKTRSVDAGHTEGTHSARLHSGRALAEVLLPRGLETWEPTQIRCDFCACKDRELSFH